MEEQRITVLGSVYKIHSNVEETDDVRIRDCDGFTDTSTKEIFLATFKQDSHTKRDLENYQNIVLRHELVHAFLFECGLDNNCDWAKSEELVDWVAIQFPKLEQLFNSVEIKAK